MAKPTVAPVQVQICFPGFEIDDVAPVLEETIAVIKAKRGIRSRWEGREMVPAGSIIDDLLRSFAAGSNIPLDLPFWTLMHEAKQVALSATQQKPPSPIPEPSAKPEHIERVRSYLINTRKLSEIVVNACIKTGKIFAAVFSPKQGSLFVNVAFRLKDGVELRGTVGDYHGVRGKKSAFVLDGKTKEVAFVESSIDALSLKTKGFNGTVVSTTGNPSSAEISKIADEYGKMGFKIFAAFDNDGPGEAMSKLIYPSERMRPINKDWNEDLVRSLEPDDVSTAPRRSRARERVR